MADNVSHNFPAEISTACCGYYIMIKQNKHWDPLKDLLMFVSGKVYEVFGKYYRRIENRLISIGSEERV